MGKNAHVTTRCQGRRRGCRENTTDPSLPGTLSALGSCPKWESDPGRFDRRNSFYQEGTPMIRICAQCHQKNRVPSARLAESGRCGACHATLAPLDEPYDVPDRDTFDDVIRHATVPVVVDFWAAWCGPCKMAAPEVKKLAKAKSGEAVVLKVDTEALPELAARYQIRGIPNFIVFQQGDAIAQHAGVVSADVMSSWLP